MFILLGVPVDSVCVVCVGSLWFLCFGFPCRCGFEIVLGLFCSAANVLILCLRLFIAML